MCNWVVVVMSAVSLSGSFLSSLLFKLKNVLGDAVSGCYSLLHSHHTRGMVCFRKGFCWAQYALTK